MTMVRGSAYGQAGSGRRAVLSAKRAARLARRATRRHDDGSRSARAWRAWRRLAEAGERGDQNAINAVWRVWQRDPGDELWEALTRWWGPDEPAERACRVVTESHEPAAQRASIADFCVRHGLAPRDENQRALFHVLTGQTAKYWAADPDGSRLAAGYQSANEPTRALLREVMADDSDLDLPYILAAHRPDRTAALTVEEGEYLAGHLAGRRDWPELWRLARDLPLTQAVAAMRLFGDGWRPDDDRDRALFGLLAEADPGAVADALGALEAPVLIPIEMDDAPTRGSFSPNSRQLLVATERRGCYSGCRVFDLPGGTLAERHDYCGGRPPQAVLHLGEAFFVVGCRGFEVWELVRYTAGQPAVIEWNQEPIIVAPHPAGFVMEKWRLGDRRLRLYDARGEVAEEVTVSVADPDRGVHLAAADLGTGRLALRGTSHLWILDSDWARVLAKLRLREKTPSGFSFVGPEHVAVTDEKGHATLYDMLGNQAAFLDDQELPACCWDFVPLRGQVAVLCGGSVRYLEPGYFSDARHRGPLHAASGQALWGSPDGRSHALGGWRDGHGFLDVAWGGDPAIQDLARRPMAGTGPDDLAAVTAALGDPVPGAAARPFLELLQACLERRVSTEAAPAG